MYRVNSPLNLRSLLHVDHRDGIYEADAFDNFLISVCVSGEHPAAMYHGPANVPLSPSLSALTVLVLFHAALWWTASI